MKFSKKLISLTLTALMLQSVFAAGSSAASAYSTDVFQSSAVSQAEASGDTNLQTFGDFMYKVENNAITIVSYGGSGASSITIPSTINNVPVKVLGDGVFANCTSLTSITIPEGIQTISDGAFFQCRFASITIPSTVTSIGDFAFQRCNNLTSIKIPNKVKTMGRYAFSMCPNLKSVTLSNSLTTIREHAFSDSGLTSVKFPSNITTIEESAFENCAELKKVTIPDSVTTIQSAAFKTDTAITDVYFLGTKAQWSKINIGSYNDAICQSDVLHYGSQSVSLSASRLTLYAGQSKTLTATITPENPDETLYWKSSNTSVATVNSAGKITAKAEGSATVTVSTSLGNTASCVVSVRRAPTAVSLSKTAETISVGQSFTLSYTLTPSDAYTVCSWSSSDTTVATVTSAGVVTAKKVGKATITVKTSNAKTATCTVTVKRVASSVTLDKTAISMGEGQTSQLTATVTPSDALTTLTWSSSNADVAAVSTSGKVSAKSAGTATVTVTTSNGKTASCSVTIKKGPTSVALSKTSDTLGVGQTLKLNVMMSPENAVTYCNWKSTDNTIATVTSAGKVTAKSPGNAVITMKTSNGRVATCELTIKKAPTSIALNKTSVKNCVGQSFTLKCTPTPSNAYKNCTWSSSNSTVASVDSSGKVTSKKQGTATITAKTYNGKAQTQAVVVKDGTTTLKSGTDYTVSYKNNINAGTATVKITGKGNYTGTVSKTFTISAASIANATVSGVSNKTYTGSAQTQNPTVKVGDKTLVSGTDYELSYWNNYLPGTAWVDIAGKGDYEGTCGRSFGIIYDDPMCDDAFYRNTSDYVVRVYRMGYLRFPSIDEVKNMVQILVGSNRTPDSVIWEVYNNNGFDCSNAQFIEAIYRLMLLRNGSRSELMNWIAELDGGATREDVIDAISVSPDYQNIWHSFGIGYR